MSLDFASMFSQMAGDTPRHSERSLQSSGTSRWSAVDPPAQAETISSRKEMVRLLPVLTRQQK
eukprot:CAMPEP_0194531610 /NCGR_PEP_ID=MMETSP0253-20130528/68958_1 /TAXON_ID=2966 /ORGANISM="Noctiluca scintillans" /LENGTH=62 /DNA_ID=CAMNT_0039376977 /DNA_START=1 /DNA_END=186 /DNA_ORIENTATION=+